MHLSRAFDYSALGCYTGAYEHIYELEEDTKHAKEVLDPHLEQDRWDSTTFCFSTRDWRVRRW